MKVLLSWLKEFTPVNVPAADLANDLASLGLSVEAMRTLGGNFPGVIVAKVNQLRPHPDADRIQLVDVETEPGVITQVCCGAFNMKVGDLVPLAQVGAVLPGGMEIARRKMRGEISDGMICSQDELELGPDSGGIMILPQGLSLGQDLAESLELEPDILFDLEVNPNRPDAMSVLGVARDVAARYKLPFNIPTPKFKERDLPQDIKADIQAPDLCGHFTLKLLHGINLKAAMPEISKRLIACGMRPLNAIVDISNYVMLELGQPTHAFDLEKVPESYFGIRFAKDKEKILTLDGQERELISSDGIIVNSSDQGISIAGVMGGSSTEVSDSTKTVAIEAAWWQPLNIARTSKRLGLRSEASARFERGVDPELAELALARIAELTQKAGAEIGLGTIKDSGNLPQTKKLKFRVSEIKRHLGIEIDSKTARQLLSSIGFQVKRGKNELDVEVPSYRLDTELEIDLVEEVARMHGYEKIPRTVPRPVTAGGLNPAQRKKREVVDLLKGFGLSEVLCLPFLAPGDLEKAGIQAPGITITNPLVKEESILRSSLRPGMLKIVAYNASRQMQGVRIFELGKVFQPKEAELPQEDEYLTVVLSGADAQESAACLKGLAEALEIEIKIQNSVISGLHPTRAAQVFLASGEVELGVLGEIDPIVSEAFGIPERVACLELNLDMLLDAAKGRPIYNPPSKYPAADFDLAFWVNKEISSQDLQEAVKQAAGELAVSVQLFDVFRSDQKRSLAYRILLQAPDRTLTDKEVSQIRNSCIQAAQKLGAEPRT